MALRVPGEQTRACPSVWSSGDLGCHVGRGEWIVVKVWFYRSSGTRSSWTFRSIRSSCRSATRSLRSNVGRSEDDTFELVRSIDNPNPNSPSDWDMTRRNTVLGVETLRAMRACRNNWDSISRRMRCFTNVGRQNLCERHRTAGRWRPKGRGFCGATPSISMWIVGAATAVVPAVVRLDPALDIRPSEAQGFWGRSRAPERSARG